MMGLGMAIRISSDRGGLLAVSKRALLSASYCALFCVPGALASEPTEFKLGSDLTIQQAASMLHYSGGNDRFRVEVAPNYSEELGWSLKGAAGGYLTDAMALGLIVEYGENKREYLANAGVQFTDELSLVGTVGLLEENNEYFDGEGRKKAQQMEYGASFKGAYEIGFLSGFELNGYLADADADSDSVETGKLYGVQLLTDLDLTDTTHVKIGGGYEWLEWDDTNDDDNRWTFSAEAVQQLGDVVSLTGNAKLGASEFVYGGGIAFDLSDDGMNTNSLGVNASYIDGRNGIEDDQRIELSWTFGFGAGPSASVASAEMTDKSGTIRAAADVATVFPANNLLSDVMKRPSYLPERVLARAEATTCPFTVLDFGAFQNLVYISSYPGGAYDGKSFVRIASTIPLTSDQLNGIGADGFTFQLGSSDLVFAGSNGTSPEFGPMYGLFFDPTTGNDKIFTARANGYLCKFVLDDYLS
jgi:hypothetical protein